MKTVKNIAGNKLTLGLDFRFSLLWLCYFRFKLGRINTLKSIRGLGRSLFLYIISYICILSNLQIYNMNSVRKLICYCCSVRFVGFILHTVFVKTMALNHILKTLIPTLNQTLLKQQRLVRVLKSIRYSRLEVGGWTMGYQIAEGCLQ